MSALHLSGGVSPAFERISAIAKETSGISVSPEMKMDDNDAQKRNIITVQLRGGDRTTLKNCIDFL